MNYILSKTFWTALLWSMSGVEFSRCGLTISVVHPFLGASPDGNHGKMLVEVKCPYKCSYQHLQDVAVNARDFCLQGTYTRL